MNRCYLLSAAILASVAGCSFPRLQVYAGTATESLAGELRADSSAGVTGATLDLEGDLGVSGTNSPLDMRLVFAMGRGVFDLAYSERSISSTGTLTGTPDFIDVTLNAGAVDMSFALQEYRASVGLRARSSGKKFITSVRVGVLGVDWSATLDDSGAQTATAGQLTILPVVGVSVEAKIGPLASFFVEAEGMDMDMLDTKARLFGWSGGIRISFIQAQLILGFRSRSLDIEEKGERFSLDTNGGTVAFQLQLALSM